MSLNEWPSKKINWLFNKIGSGSTPNSSNEAYYNSDDIPWLLTGDLNDNYISKPSKYISNKAFQENTALIKFPRNSLVMAMYGATIGKLGITTYETTTNQACCVFGEPKEIEVKYTFYWLMANRKEIINLSHGGGQPNISQGIIKNIRISVPPIDDQKKIVRFIDIKYNEINKIIDTKLKLIELLEQQRQSIITEAVTKGLNPNVKMKDSGVEWIGEIPEHWELKALKYSFKIGNGKEIENELAFDDLSGVNVYGSGGVFKKTDNVLFDGESVLFGRKGTIGKPMYVNESFWTVDTMYYTKYNPESYAKWFYYLLTVYPWSTITTHTALPSVVGSDIANSVCGIPSYREQIEIANYLSEKDEEVNSLIIIIKQSIDKLKEYRQSLIYEAVTGKIDVGEMELELVR